MGRAATPSPLYRRSQGAGIDPPLERERLEAGSATDAADPASSPRIDSGHCKPIQKRVGGQADAHFIYHRL